MSPPRIGQSLIRALQWHGRRRALVDEACPGGGTLTWNEFGSRIFRLATVLRENGVARGDRVAILAHNNRRYLETYFAAIWAGAVIAPLNHRLNAAELSVIMSDAEPTALVIGDEFLPLLPQLRDASPSLRCIILAEQTGHDDMLGYENAIAGAGESDEAGCGGDDLACLYYTGGTTGGPKGVMLSHANIVLNSLNMIGTVPMDGQTVNLHAGPLFHVAAGSRVFSVTQAGGTHVILPRFAARPVLEAVQQYRITHASMVPTLLRLMVDELNLHSYDTSSWQWITYGAAPSPEALLRAVMEKLPHVKLGQSYGMTELAPIATVLAPEDHHDSRLIRSVGRTVLSTEVRIADPEDNSLAAGQTGEILVRGPTVMSGYWRRPELSAEVLRGGWMHTGDLGYLDEDGYLFVVDRLKDMIISGGENVASQEVENVLAEHPAVDDCAVIGLPDPVWGEAVHAVIVLRAGATASEAELIAHCRASLAPFKCPRGVTFRKEPMPLSGANKILKTALREDLSRN